MAVAELSLEAAAGDRLARRNAMVLAAAQALAGANNTVIVTTGGRRSRELRRSLLCPLPLRERAQGRKPQAQMGEGVSSSEVFCEETPSPNRIR